MNTTHSFEALRFRKSDRHLSVVRCSDLALIPHAAKFQSGNRQWDIIVEAASKPSSKQFHVV